MEFLKHLKREHWNGKSVGSKVKTTLLAAMTLIFGLFVTLFLVAMFIHAPWIAVIIFTPLLEQCNHPQRPTTVTARLKIITVRGVG